MKLQTVTVGTFEYLITSPHRREKVTQRTGKPQLRHELIMFHEIDALYVVKNSNRPENLVKHTARRACCIVYLLSSQNR